MFVRFQIRGTADTVSYNGIRELVAAIHAVANSTAGVDPERPDLQGIREWEVLDNSVAPGWSVDYVDSDLLDGGGGISTSTYYPIHLSAGIDKTGDRHVSTQYRKAFTLRVYKTSSTTVRGWYTPIVGWRLPTYVPAYNNSAVTAELSGGEVFNGDTTQRNYCWNAYDAGPIDSWFILSMTSEGIFFWHNQTTGRVVSTLYNSTNVSMPRFVAMSDTVGGDPQDYTDGNATLPALELRTYYNNSSTSYESQYLRLDMRGWFTYDSAGNAYSTTNGIGQITPGYSDTSQSIDTYYAYTAPKFRTSNLTGASYETLYKAKNDKNEAVYSLQDVIHMSPSRGISPRSMKRLKFVGYQDAYHLGSNIQNAMDHNYMNEGLTITDADGNKWYTIAIAGICFAVQMN